ncbi:BCCT family transporter [Shewanella benthica]|uniref:BCCT family transporter n=1 Tax=Shewanella benthica TaxID=43661 RepID=UPI000681FB02|nr:BCCT family transporter [Shewanella benthica]
MSKLSRESIGLICCCIAAAAFLIFPETAISLVAGVTAYAIHEFGLAFIIIPSLFVILSLAIALSPWGKIKLGKDSALALTYFHWGLHAWSLYAISGLVMAWFAFNKSRPMTISASFTDKPESSWYQVFDLLAVVAVIFGVAGTLANTIALVQSGVEHRLRYWWSFDSAYSWPSP